MRTGNGRSVGRTGCVVLALVLTLPAACRHEPEPPSRIVFIVIDTLRRDHLPFYGYDKPTAPFLASLAERGVVFDDPYSTSAWTGPATASIFTGLYPFQHGVVTGYRATQRLQEDDPNITLNRIPDVLETLPEAMKQAGYATFAVTENPNIGEEMGFAAGFDRFRNFPFEEDARFINEALLRWRDELEAVPRAFVYLHYMDPHGPYQVRRPWFKRFLGDDRQVAAYDSEIGYLDSHIAKLVEELGWDQDALFVVTADHGEELGERGNYGHGHTLYAEILDVPLLIAFPGGRHGGRRVSAPVSHVDLLPTLREVVGLPADPHQPGRSLLALARGETDSLDPRPLLAHLQRQEGEAGRDKTLRGMLEGDWKLIDRDREAPLLFQRRRDPGDLHDLAGEHPDVVRAMARRYAEIEKLAPRVDAETRSIEIDPETQERLRALGYVQ